MLNSENSGICRDKRRIVAEPTDWVGGQLTSQAVPPDENRWIEGAEGVQGANGCAFQKFIAAQNVAISRPCENGEGLT